MHRIKPIWKVYSAGKRWMIVSCEVLATGDVIRRFHDAASKDLWSCRVEAYFLTGTESNSSPGLLYDGRAISDAFASYVIRIRVGRQSIRKALNQLFRWLEMVARIEGGRVKCPEIPTVLVATGRLESRRYYRASENRLRPRRTL